MSFSKPTFVAPFFTISRMFVCTPHSPSAELLRPSPIFVCLQTTLEPRAGRTRKCHTPVLVSTIRHGAHNTCFSNKQPQSYPRAAGVLQNDLHRNHSLSTPMAVPAPSYATSAFQSLVTGRSSLAVLRGCSTNRPHFVCHN